MTTKLENVIDKALYLIASGQTITATAQECGISRQALSDAINNNDEIFNKLQDIRDDINSEAGDKLRSLYLSAIDYLQSMFDGDEMTPQQKTSIALAIVRTPTASMKSSAKRSQFDFMN